MRLVVVDDFLHRPCCCKDDRLDVDVRTWTRTLFRRQQVVLHRAAEFWNGGGMFNRIAAVCKNELMGGAFGTVAS